MSRDLWRTVWSFAKPPANLGNLRKWKATIATNSTVSYAGTSFANIHYINTVRSISPFWLESAQSMLHVRTEDSWRHIILRLLYNLHIFKFHNNLLEKLSRTTERCTVCTSAFSTFSDVTVQYIYVSWILFFISFWTQKNKAICEVEP